MLEADWMEVPTLATEDAGGSLQLVETAQGGEPAVALNAPESDFLIASC